MSTKNIKKTLPPVKKWQGKEGRISLKKGVAIKVSSHELRDEKAILEEMLKGHQVPVNGNVPCIYLETANISFPSIRQSDYRERIREQGYRLVVSYNEIKIQAPRPAGIFYGIQTLNQMINNKQEIAEGEIEDWPDLPMRMFMVDLGHQCENMEYYKRIIRFCGKYKMNVLVMHFTDNQDVCLYHEDYPSIMHPHALCSRQVAELVALAERYHLEIIPEIESFGHCEVFKRHPQRAKILHGWPENKGTQALCPASELTYEYLDKMFARAAQEFPSSIIHVGMDEVKTKVEDCRRCQEKWPGISHTEWFLKHLLRCYELVSKYGKRMAIWRDVLCKHQEIAEAIPKDILVFEWNYYSHSTERKCGDLSRPVFLKEKGFELIGCPAVIAEGNHIFPPGTRYTNIERYAEVARECDLLGMSTTTWSCSWYLADTLWPGIAFAAEQSWGGSNWDEISFCGNFLQDFFGCSEGKLFAEAWKDMVRYMPFTRMTSSLGIRNRKKIPETPSRIYDDVFVVSCWFDKESLDKAREYAGEWGEEFQFKTKLTKLCNVRRQLAQIREKVSKNRTEWDTMEKAVAITIYTLEHLYASRHVYSHQKWDIQRIKELDELCVQAIAWLEQDWDRNRFIEDRSEKRIGNYSAGHGNVLDRFYKMHKFHQKLLKQDVILK